MTGCSHFLSSLGLTARIGVAAAAGLTGPGGVAVATAGDMKHALATLLCSAPDAATDLGGHHDVFQFLPAYSRDAKLNALLLMHPWIRHHGGGMVGAAMAGAAMWPDVVDYTQVITITRANAAVGPVDCPVYFNM